MRLLIQFSGEHPLLALSELESVLAGEGLQYLVIEHYSEGRLVIIEVKSRDTSFLGRLALASKAGVHVASSSSLKVLADKLAFYLSGKSFKVNCKSMRVARKLGGLLHDMGFRVDVHDPDATVDCYTANGRFHAGLRVELKRDFESRRPQLRSFFHPTSMHPKIARVLVNLARLKGGDSVLDPFCGTGGILIEAGLMGLKVFGLDVDERMVAGSRENLRHYSLSGVVKKGDALKCNIQADAVVTDPPYGRSSYLGGEEPQKLYEGFIKHAGSMLSSGGFMVLVAPKQYSLDFPGFKAVNTFDLRIHKSLTRRIWVTQKT